MQLYRSSAVIATECDIVDDRTGNARIELTPLRPSIGIMSLKSSHKSRWVQFKCFKIFKISTPREAESLRSKCTLPIESLDAMLGVKFKAISQWKKTIMAKLGCTLNDFTNKMSKSMNTKSKKAQFEGQLLLLSVNPVKLKWGLRQRHRAQVVCQENVSYF